MADKILSAITYDRASNSYANLSPEQSPLLINDNGDLIFNTQNLSLYNSGSNNRILRNNSSPQFTDNVLIGSNNSYIYGNPHTIINSCNSYISGNYLHPDGSTTQQLDSIYNSTTSCIINSYASRIDSASFGYISGGCRSSLQNSLDSCILYSFNSNVIGGQQHIINGSYFFISTTGQVTTGPIRGNDANIVAGGCQLSTLEANVNLQRFNSVLGGTGWANGYNSVVQSFNSAGGLFVGCSNKLVTSQKSSIIGGQGNCISGTTVGSWIVKNSNAIAIWKNSENNSILSSKNSKILDQVSESIILGGDSNCIIAQDFPYYDCRNGITQYSRTIANSNIIGGVGNVICSSSHCSSIIGSFFSTIESGCNSIILGGYSSKICANSCNSIAQGATSIIDGCYSSVGGGSNNQISGNYNFIGGGEFHRNCTEKHSVIVGGYQNRILASSLNKPIANCSFVGGGSNNWVTSFYGFVGGGCNNRVEAPYGYIVGGRNTNITHSGAAVLGDGQNRAHNSSGTNTLTLDFASGVYFAQTGVFGQINFSIRPKVNNENILTNGDSVVFTTGDQNIAGIKTFTSTPTVNSSKVVLFGSLPTNANSPGTSGQIATDSNYFYSYDGSKWKRTALSEW